MIVPGSVNSLLLSSTENKFLPPQGSGRSLRFRGGCYFTKSFPAAGDLTKWSVSFWVKRAQVKTSGIYQTLIGSLQSSGATTEVGFGNNYNDAIYFTWNSYNYVISTEVYDDETDWIHVVYVWDTNNPTLEDRIRTYINGRRTTPRAGAGFPGVGQSSYWNSTVSSFIGSWGSSQTFIGFMSDFINIDGQALDCNSFGQFDPSKKWIVKEYKGAFGKNGFHLDFKDTAQIGKDVSGNNNHWTPNGFDLAAPGTQATYDYVKDFPQPYLDGTDRPPGNYAVLDYKHPAHTTLTNANLTASGATDMPTLRPTSGNWYFEINGVGKQWTPPAPFPAAAGNYNFGQLPFTGTIPAGFKTLCLTNMI